MATPFPTLPFVPSAGWNAGCRHPPMQSFVLQILEGPVTFSFHFYCFMELKKEVQIALSNRLMLHDSTHPWDAVFQMVYTK